MGPASLKLAQDSEAIVVAVRYRLAPETSFPGPVEDCHAVLVWLFEQATTLGVDPARVAVLARARARGWRRR